MISESSETLKRPNPNYPNPRSKKKSCSSVGRHDHHSRWYTVDLEDLLFTPYRHFLVRNNGRKVWVDELKGKTIVLYIAPINVLRLKPGEALDMVQAYQELLPLGGIEFVFVPVYLQCVNIECSCFNYNQTRFAPQEDYYNHLLSTMPWPAVPYSDFEACGERVVETFSVDHGSDPWYGLPYWVIIDPTSTVVATRSLHPYLFKIFNGAELYPLSFQRIYTLWDEYGFRYGDRRESRSRLIRNWDQLLASPTRDFLLSSNGDRVPISSLRGRLIGLYFCENVPNPPRMDVIKEAYREAKLRGYDFEIVQINFHFHCFKAIYCDADLSDQQHYENINWLTLPFKDPSCRKLQRIFKCEFNCGVPVWRGDCLVIIDSRPRDDGVSDEQYLFEFSGADIIEQYGIEGYPFARQILFEREYTRQKKEVKLQSYFRPGLCHFTQAVCDGRFDLVNYSQLERKRVLVLFADSKLMAAEEYVSMMKSRYHEQQEEGDKFEVVYISTDDSECSFRECVEDMPWLVHPYSPEFGKWCNSKILKLDCGIIVTAFDINGQLIAKKYLYAKGRQIEYHTHRFPFFSHDLFEQIEDEVVETCHLDWYH